MTAIYCDKDHNAETLKSRKGAETLVAMVKGGYKAKVRLGNKPEDNRGDVYQKQIKIMCAPKPNEAPSQEFKDAKALLDKAYNDKGILHNVDPGLRDWELEQ